MLSSYFNIAYAIDISPFRYFSADTPIVFHYIRYTDFYSPCHFRYCHLTFAAFASHASAVFLAYAPDIFLIIDDCHFILMLTPLSLFHYRHALPPFD